MGGPQSQFPVNFQPKSQLLHFLQSQPNICEFWSIPKSQLILQKQSRFPAILRTNPRSQLTGIRTLCQKIICSGQIKLIYSIQWITNSRQSVNFDKSREVSKSCLREDWLIADQLKTLLEVSLLAFILNHLSFLPKTQDLQRTTCKRIIAQLLSQLLTWTDIENQVSVSGKVHSI